MLVAMGLHHASHSWSTTPEAWVAGAWRGSPTDSPFLSGVGRLIIKDCIMLGRRGRPPWLDSARKYLQSAESRAWTTAIVLLRHRKLTRPTGDRTVKAYLVDSPNAPFRAIEMLRPEPAANQVLVRICASGRQTRWDTKIRAGQAAHARQSLPRGARPGYGRCGRSCRCRTSRRFRCGDEVFRYDGAAFGGRQGTLAEFYRRG